MTSRSTFYPHALRPRNLRLPPHRRGRWTLTHPTHFDADIRPHNRSFFLSSSLASTLTVTLDYHGFPHIFANVVEHCDFPIQNTLRLLSASTKVDVDRHQCGYLDVYTKDRFTGLRIAGTYEDPPCTANWAGNDFSDLIRQRSHPPPFSLQHTRYLGLDCSTVNDWGELVWDSGTGFGFPQPPLWLRDLSLDCMIEIWHTARDFDDEPTVRRDIQLPTVRNLHIFLLPGAYGNECACDTERVVHSAKIY